jgi:superfamily II DNA or RNA helicase
MATKSKSTPASKSKLPKTIESSKKAPSQTGSQVALPKRRIVPIEEFYKDPALEKLEFKYPLRGYQKEIVDLVNSKLAKGEREIHIVAPPGAGKTIIGLQMIATVKCPAIILCPNTTIQSQWGQKLDLFIPEEEKMFGNDHLLGTHEDKPLKPITVLTYQVLSTPGQEQEYLEKLAHNSWAKELVKSRNITLGEAELRIIELLQNNPKAHQKEISRHVSRLRRKLSEVMDLNEVLHKNAIELLQSLRRQKFKLVLFDECHHLTDYWAAIMQHLIKYLDDPIVIGLTGTPPEKKSASQETRYLSLVGDIDYQVPTPALVKEGGLAPFQDLVFFVEPTGNEFKFLEEQHEDFHLLINELLGIEQEFIRQPGNEKIIVYKPLSAHLMKLLEEYNQEAGYAALMKSAPNFARAFIRICNRENFPRPKGIDVSEDFLEPPTIDDWMLLLENYASHKLKLSSNPLDHQLYIKITSAVRKLGYGITEQGLRKQASPSDRVLAFSQAKANAVCEIMALEYRVMQERLRACVVTDFERMSATSVKGMQGVISEESGGAIQVMRVLLNSPISYYVNPCLVTGSLLLVDNRIKEQYLEAARAYLKENGHNFELTINDGEQYFEITSGSGAWESRLYVAMATAIFERGITKCLIGTRGLFGEGWDSQSLNTLLDLTTTTSPVSVKQLRGRSIRIQTNDAVGAHKVANNWDVVCIAPSLEKGLNDYDRFVRKHDGFFGLCDDGQIECGVGHVHPSFSELTPTEVFASLEEFNKEMMERALVRDGIWEMWKIGQPYRNKLVECLEVKRLRKQSLTPPHLKVNLKYKEHAKELRAHLNGIWFEYLGLGTAFSIAGYFLMAGLGMAAFSLAPLVLAGYFGKLKHAKLFAKIKRDTCKPNTQESSLKDIARAIFSALRQARLIEDIDEKPESCIQVTVRQDGSYRIYLEKGSPEANKCFNQAMSEVLAPVAGQPYLIPKYEFPLPPDPDETVEDKFFQKYLNAKLEPKVGSYHPVPNLLARSERGRNAFQEAWNKYVSPGFILTTQNKPELVNRYYGIGPSLAQRILWE